MTVQPFSPLPADPTIVVTGDYLIAHGQRLELNGNPTFQLAANGGHAALEIAGVVTVANSMDASVVGIASKDADTGQESVQIDSGGKLKVVASADGALAAGIMGDFIQSVAVEGQISVSGDSAYAVSGALDGAGYHVDGVLNAHAESIAIGLQIQGNGSTGYNGGVIKAKANAAIGVDAEAANVSFTNDGIILAKGFTAEAQITVGCAGEQGVSFTNNGVVLVRALDGGLGVIIDNAADFLNTGRITVQSSPDASKVAAGLFVSGTTPASYVNAGRIQGPYAIDSEAVAATGVSDFVNEGKLLGLVKLGSGQDAFTNTGKMHGDVQLGDGDDSFDSSHGKLSGVVQGGAGDDTVLGGAGRDTLYGDTSADPSSGGDDLLRGGKGMDSIDGGAGADTISGGDDRDQLTGGAGADTFVFRTVSESAAGASDLITDLQAGDVISLAAIDADTGAAGDQAFHLVGAFSGAAGELVVVYNAASGRTVIQGDVDGDGQADLSIAVRGDHHDFTNFAL